MFLKIIFFCTGFFYSLTAACQNIFLFIGTYTGSGSKGIYVYRFDPASGKLDSLYATSGVVNPSFLAVAAGGKYLYACTETATVNAGGISAFAVNRNNGSLAFLNKQPSGGDNPVYVSVHNSGKWIVAGNYSGGSLAAFRINGDGSLQPYSQLIQHTGRSVNLKRQDRPHVHSTVFSPGGEKLFVPDLGLDKIMIYDFDPSAGKPMQPSSQAFMATDTATGPRHFTFHPQKKFAYLLEEMGGAVDVYRYKKNKLVKRQHIAAHPDTATGDFGSADIHLSPDGKFLYASNRGRENNIAIFSVKRNGRLTYLGLQPALGVRPRNFAIDPSGNYLFVANQVTNNVVVFKRDKQTGLLTYTGRQIKVPEPVCLKFSE